MLSGERNIHIPQKKIGFFKGIFLHAMILAMFSIGENCEILKRFFEVQKTFLRRQ